MDRINDRLDKLFTKISSIDVTLASQHENLKEHMKRSDALEKQIEHLNKEVEPVKRHMFMINGALKLLGSASVIIAILRLFKLF